jgi:hypothetical protein
MKNIIANIWNWFVGLLDKIRRDRLYHFIAGLIFAAFFFIVLGMSFCVWPVIFIAFFKELIDVLCDHGFDLWDFAATIIGGLVIQLFVIL